jgi:hypothetical protein
MVSVANNPSPVLERPTRNVGSGDLFGIENEGSGEFSLGDFEEVAPLVKRFKTAPAV